MQNEAKKNSHGHYSLALREVLDSVKVAVTKSRLSEEKFAQRYLGYSGAAYSQLNGRDQR